MTEIIQITDHVTKALDRIISQYKGKPLFEAFLSTFVKQVQDIEDATFGLIAGRSLDNAIGEQLDKIGTIVGQERGNFDDDFYRILLFVKIGQNTSQGGPNKAINIFKLLTQADLVHYMNLNSASIMLATSGVISSDQVNFIFRSMELVIAGGVRIDHIASFDAIEPFSFSGPNTDAPGLGFSDITGTTGGKLAKLHSFSPDFAFDGNDVDAGGFGSLLDPVAGGIFVGIGG